MWSEVGASDGITVDSQVSTITNLKPSESSITGKLKPVISADYSDTESGIDTSTAKLYLDGENKTSESTITESSISYTSQENLSEGAHTARVEVKDKAGNPAEVTWQFKVLSGEVNGDGTVNIFDLVTVGRAFGSQPGDSNWNPAADLNGDNIINIFDLVIVGRNFGKSNP